MEEVSVLLSRSGPGWPSMNRAVAHPSRPPISFWTCFPARLHHTLTEARDSARQPEFDTARRRCFNLRPVKIYSLMNPITKVVYELHESTLMTGRAFRRAGSKPYYLREIVIQMDTIGVGSLMIIVLTGLFTGGILALQTSKMLQTFGATGVTGMLVMTSLVREMGPVLASLMLAGRVGSSIAAELGSMVVSEQVDAMRALGTDPIKKLVWPRLFALMVMAPALTLVADMIGAFGGWVVSSTLMNVASSVYISSAKQALTYNDIIGGLLKPTVFGLIIAIVSCRTGLRTHGGTVGVGRSVTQCVVTSDILILVADFFLSKLILTFK